MTEDFLTEGKVGLAGLHPNVRGVIDKMVRGLRKVNNKAELLEKRVSVLEKAAGAKAAVKKTDE